MNITRASVTQIAEAIRLRQLSSVEAVEACLERIAAVNPILNAVVCLTADSARREAREADAELARGKLRGPLHGVPMTIKDSLDTMGVVSTAGTLGRRSFIPDRDATVVARLKAAGAILLGKTNTPELTLAFETDNLIFGRTSNPYDPTKTCGGSSGGAAAIVAAGGSAFDVGSDTGGSIRIPSHCCGVAGLRPTSGRVSRAGHIVGTGGLLDSLTVIGPIARYVEDLGLILSIIAGVDFVDPSIVEMPLAEPGKVEIRALRVGVYTDNGILSPNPSVIQTVEAAASALSNAGLSVEADRPPGIEETSQLYRDLWTADGGFSVRELLAKCGTTQPHPWLNRFDIDSKASPSVESLLRRVERWDAFRARMLEFIRKYDVLLCPAFPFEAWSHATFLDPERITALSYTSSYNLTGWPAAVARCGTSPGGLPIAVQVVGRPWREDVVLAVAKHLEDVFGGWSTPDNAPPLHPLLVSLREDAKLD